MKEVLTLHEAIARSGLTSGMRISFHHHLRLGDRVVSLVLGLLEELNYTDLTLCVSSIMGDACEAVLRSVRAGVVTNIETTGMKSPLSEAVLNNEVPNPVVFRTHGGRARAIEQGQTPIDVAFIAASAADREGNLNGTVGPNPFGSMGYAIPDALHATYVIAITDFLSDERLTYRSIEAKLVDVLVTVDSIGESDQVSGGSLRVSQNPTERVIAERTLAVMQAAGVLKDGFNYQAGSGGISLLVTNLLELYMKEHALQGGFASGGITGTLVRMAKEGLFHTLWDVQSFDGEAALSVAENAFHKEMSASLYANPDNPDCIAHQLDVMVLSATEVDLNFNVNSITGTDGRILGALGGGPDTAYGAKLTIVVLPSFRGRIPMINKEVNLVCTPGSDVDVVVTERGIAVNPRREDLYRALCEANLKPISIQELMQRIHFITGEPTLPKKEGRTVAVVEDRYGKKLSELYTAL